MGVVAPLAIAARPLIATLTVVPGLPVIRTTTLVLSERLISGNGMWVSLDFTATTMFAVTRLRQGCQPHYHYTGNASNYHDEGGVRASDTSA